MSKENIEEVEKIIEVKADKKTEDIMSFTPKDTVAELDRYIIGQNNAKRAVAIALRNRWRRQRLEGQMREEVLPKNILMIGPTGVGKTEISRRLAKMAEAPFIKVEATKFTEVGYVGRDVESIIRDLMDLAINISREKHRKFVLVKAEAAAEDRVLEVLVGKDATESTKEVFRNKLRDGVLNQREIEIAVLDKPASGSMPSFDIPGMPGAQMGMISIGDMLGDIGGKKTKTRKMTVEKSYDILIQEEADKLLDEEKIIEDAKFSVENHAIVFIDEIDKIAGRSDNKRGDVSREGVQRDLLPLIEGTTVATKHGMIKTDHILFVASGAFHYSKPSDLLPELQGRLPIRVELRALEEKDFIRILKEPKFSLIKQYIALMKTEGVELEFKDDAINQLAKLAVEINNNIENIGARRLHTVLEKLLEELSFAASDKSGEKIIIDKEMVNDKLADLSKDQDLSKFIL